jgi:propanol-preferring alcohol dehydrogenase
MKAMILKKLGRIKDLDHPLELTELPIPIPKDGEILIKVSACGVCHTELDIIEGRTPPPILPLIPGHQVVGRVVGISSTNPDLRTGDRVGVGWIFSSCGKCEYCLSGQENLCGDFRATGRDVHGGYAEYMLVPDAFCHPIPDPISDIEAAPMLCAGAIGYRSLNLAAIQDGDILGLTGFGASAHLVLKMARYRYPNSEIFVFTRSIHEQEFARSLGAVWAGDMDDMPPALIHAIIDTTPAWKPIVKALENLRPGGRLVINAIRKECNDHDYLLQLEYPKHLWLEKEIKSVANVTRADIRQFLELAVKAGIKPETQTYPLIEANQALVELKNSKVHGAKVLLIDQ